MSAFIRSERIKNLMRAFSCLPLPCDGAGGAARGSAPPGAQTGGDTPPGHLDVPRLSSREGFGEAELKVAGFEGSRLPSHQLHVGKSGDPRAACVGCRRISLQMVSGHFP